MTLQTIQNQLPVTIIRKSIKHLYLRIKAPLGEIIVSAPHRMSDAAIEQFLLSRQSWIIEKQKEVAGRSPQQPLSENQIKFLGKVYSLVKDGSSGNRVLGIVNEKLHFSSTLDSAQNLNTILTKWYRQELGRLMDTLLSKWQPIIKVFPKFIGIRAMRSRWGSCNTSKGRIWLSQHLIHHPPECIEYVFVHEMVHLIEASHNHYFKQLMTQFLPDWKERRSLLNGKID